MIYYLKVYFISLLGFLAIDFVWLAFVARGFYRKHLGFLLTDQPNWWAAVAFYLPFVAGMVVFVVAPIQAASLRKALLLGAFFGLVTYATYDLTNHATIKNWPWIVTVIDLCWGAVLAATVSSIGFLAGRWLEIRLPLKAFQATWFGRKQPNAPEINGADIRSLGFTLADKKAGPFKLDVDWIGAASNAASAP